MPDQVREHLRTPAEIVASCNNLLILFAINTPEKRDIDGVARQLEIMSRRYTSGVGFLLCARAGVRPPSQEMRERMFSFFKNANQLQGCAWVVRGEGFMPAAVRSIFSALTLTLRTSYPTKVFNDVPSSLAWLAGRIDGLDGAHFDWPSLSDEINSIANSLEESVVSSVP